MKGIWDEWLEPYMGKSLADPALRSEWTQGGKPLPRFFALPVLQSPHSPLLPAGCLRSVFAHLLCCPDSIRTPPMRCCQPVLLPAWSPG